jgi:hypothetical protein
MMVTNIAGAPQQAPLSFAPQAPANIAPQAPANIAPPENVARQQVPHEAVKASQRNSASTTTPLFNSLQDIQVRLPHPSELKFFKQNTHIPAMMTEDGAVTENPFAKKPDGKPFSPKELAAVQMNEKIRVWLKRQEVNLGFDLTPAQQKQFKTYGELQDIQHTIIARILTGDPSAGEATPEQQAIAQQVKAAILQNKGTPNGP